MTGQPTDDSRAQLTPEEAHAVMKAIEEVEKEEAAEQERQAAQRAAAGEQRTP